MNAITLTLRHCRMSVIEKQEREIARLRRKVQAQRGQLYFQERRIGELCGWLGRLKDWLLHGLVMELILNEIDERMNIMLDGVDSGGDTTDEEEEEEATLPSLPIPPTPSARTNPS